MGGGLMQLVAYGAQDVYLTGNPQITFFKVVYRRHTNFSMEDVQQTIAGTSTLTDGSTSNGTVTISRNGDLVHKVYVRCDQDTTDGIAGDNLITDVLVEIGGQQIDKHTLEWMQVMNELKTPESKANALKYMTGGFSNSLSSGKATASGGTEQNSIIVPLQFWFCNNPGLALPLIALQYHEVKLKFTWTSGAAAGGVSRLANAAVAPSVEVWANYIYLDTDERRRFAQVSHEYLIEQVQIQSESSTNSKFKLNFNHPVKELIWTSVAAAHVAIQKAKIVLNGHDRFAQKSAEYFQLYQPLNHHTAVPGFNIKETERPVFISPTTLAITTHNSTVDATAAAIGNDGASPGGPETIIKFDSLTANIPKVGDILHIALGSEHTADDAVHIDQPTFQLVTANDGAGDPTITISPGILATQIPAGYTNGDGLTITIIGRVQDPKSRTSSLAVDVNCYSFALKPEEHQPSGTCNFSRIDTAHLQYSAAPSQNINNIYAVNYNVLRIMSGMGGLAYSN